MLKLYPHQQEVLEKTEDSNRVAYYLDMGLGKTFIGAEKALSFGKPILMICQKSKISDWIDHFQEFYTVEVQNLRDEIKLADVMVINYELAWRRPELANLKDYTLMLDESSLIQNTKAKQTKFILKLEPENVVLLSGTPTGGKYENLWSQAKLLGWKISEKTFLTHYVNWESIDIGGGVFKKRPKKSNPYKNEDRLKRKFRDNGAVFMKTDEVVDLPEQNFIEVKVDNIPQYHEFNKESYVKVDGEELIGDSILVKRLRLRELASSYNPNKAEALKGLIESTNDRLVIFYNYNKELEQIQSVIPENRPVGIINGDIKNIEPFKDNNDGILLVQYQAGSMGLNLQQANKIIYYSPTDRAEHWMQSQKRIHRIGQERPCFYYLLTTKNSIENDIYRAIKRGEDYTDELFRESYTL